MTEEFGADLEEFGAEESAPGEARTDLLALYEDLSKQIAATMDDVERQRIRNARQAVLGKLTTKTESDWLALSKTYSEAFSESKAFQNKLNSLNGLSDAAFEQMTKDVLEKLEAKKGGTAGGDKPKTTRTRAKKTDEKPAETTAPDERFVAVIKHAKNLGLDAQIIFDELGYSIVDAASVEGTLAEINKRSAANTAPVHSVPVPDGNGGEVEEFGAGDDGDSPSIPDAAPSLPPPPLPPVQSVGDNGGAEGVGDAVTGEIEWIIDNAIQGKINPETGEIVDRSWILKILGWADFPKPGEFTKEHATDIVRVVNMMWLTPARIYREQAEKMAAPLEKKAAFFDEIFGPLLDKLGDKELPRVKKVDSPNYGKFREKTLHLATGSISWTKGGGNYLDQGQMYGWLARKKEEMLILREQGTPEALEELKALESKYGLRLKTEVDFNKSLLERSELPFAVKCPVNEFSERKIK